MALTPLFVAHAEWGGMVEMPVPSPGTGQVAASTAQAKTGTYSFQLNTSTSTGRYGLRTVPATRQLRLGAWAHPGPNLVPATSAQYVSFCTSAGTELWSVRAVENADEVGIYRAGVKQSSAAVTYSEWQHWGIDAKIDSVAGWFNFYVDGVLILSYTGDTGNADIEQVRIGGFGTNRAFSSSPFSYLDDIYVEDATGETEAAGLADRRFLLMLPTADAGPNDWTPSTGTDHYDVVDDVPVNTATYLSASAVDLAERFTAPAPTVPEGYAVRRLWVQANALRTDVGVASQYKLTVDADESAAITPATAAEMGMAVFDTTDTSQEFGALSAGTF